MCFDKWKLLSVVRVKGCSRDVLYEPGKDDVISGVDDFRVIADSVRGTFDNREDGPLVGINNDGSLHELVVVGKKDPGAVEDELV